MVEAAVMAGASIGAAVSIWDVQLDHLRASRLLALRMHVARYVVSTGATRRTAIALVDQATYESKASVLFELLEEAGAVEPQVMAMPDETNAALPAADVVLVGEGGRSSAELAQRWRAATPQTGVQLWAIDVDRIVGEPGPSIVESVESLIRIVIPEALGANGTPPSEDVAIRLV